MYNLDVNTDEVVRAKFGLAKGFPRALEKMKHGKTLRDLSRVTFEFEDSLLMAMCFEGLNKKYNIHGLKNKYLQEMFKDMPGVLEWLLETDFSKSAALVDALYLPTSVTGMSIDTPHSLWFDTFKAKVAYYKNEEWNEQVKSKLAEIEAMLKDRLEAEQLENG